MKTIEPKPMPKPIDVPLRAFLWWRSPARTVETKLDHTTKPRRDKFPPQFHAYPWDTMQRGLHGAALCGLPSDPERMTKWSHQPLDSEVCPECLKKVKS